MSGLPLLPYRFHGQPDLLPTSPAQRKERMTALGAALDVFVYLDFLSSNRNRLWPIWFAYL